MTADRDGAPGMSAATVWHPFLGRHKITRVREELPVAAATIRHEGPSGVIGVQVGERYRLDIGWGVSERGERVRQRTAVGRADEDTADRHGGVDITESGVNRQRSAVPLDQQAAGRHRHPALCVECVGMARPVRGRYIRKEPGRRQAHRAVNHIGQSHIAELDRSDR